MPKPYYTVEYHLICVTYFSHDVPTSENIALAWTSLRALGNIPMEMSMFCRGETKSSRLDESLVGSPAMSELLIARGDEVLAASACSVRPDAKNAVSDSDVTFIFSRNQIWEGQEAPAILELSVSGQVLEQVGTTAMCDVLKGVLDLVDRNSPICALVDLARPQDAFAGMVYGTAWPRTAPLSRWVEHMNWVYSGAKRGDRLRGLYWGNYLGRKILSQLGGREKVLEACEKNLCNYDGTPNSHRWPFANGLFISLCFDPLDCRPGAPSGLAVAAEANLRWLSHELGTKGVLNHW
jgi:hypothetical protein